MKFNAIVDRRAPRASCLALFALLLLSSIACTDSSDGNNAGLERSFAQSAGLVPPKPPGGSVTPSGPVQDIADGGDMPSTMGRQLLPSSSGGPHDELDGRWDDWNPEDSLRSEDEVGDEVDDEVDEPNRPNQSSPLGINLSEVRYFSSNLPFVDGFKSASRWATQTIPFTRWNTGAPIDVDADGWVRSLAPGKAVATLMFGSLEGHYPAGDYVCLYDGEGVIEWRQDGVLIEKTPGREVVRVTPTDAGVVCRILSTNPANHLRNIRFLMPGFEATYAGNPWRPGFLSRWEKFKVLRFMDWQRTNHSPLARWSDRTLPTRFSFHVSTGVPLEYMIDLCNRTGADPWFCIPHLADDDFVRQFATMVFNNLVSSRKVYIEYSNETWNASFAQEAYVRQRGIDLKLNPSMPSEARNLYHAQRITEIASIFETVFGGTDRLVRVLAVQNVNSQMTREMLAHVVGSERVSDNIDAVAVAPYVGMAVPPWNATTIANKPVADILAILYGRIPAFEFHIRAQLSAIGDLPIDLIAYEGGQALRGRDGAENNSQLTDKLIAVNRDAGMGPFYEFYLATWRAAGGKLFVPFNSTFKAGKSGSWGHLEYYDSDEQAMGKYSAMIKFIDTNQIWW